MKKHHTNMKFLLPPTLISCLLLFLSFIPGNQTTGNLSPLSAYSSEWNDAKYLKCNTAAKTKYLTAAEKEVIYILNLARTNPVLFANTVVKKYPAKTDQWYISNSDYYKSLLDTLVKIKPAKLLYPDSLCYAGALCHAITSGRDGYVGHERRNGECKNKWHFNGECCDYGHSNPLEIIMSLLIDEDVPSLGHRMILLSSYKGIGLSIQPHKVYRYTTVLDFYY